MPGLDNDGPEPLYRRLYLALREAILAGRLRHRLPSTRLLAAELGISRNSVAAAFELLHAEGYLEACRGSGSFVAAALPDQSPVTPAVIAEVASAPRRISLLSRRLPEAREEKEADFPFAITARAFADFPWAAWSRLLARPWRRPSPALILSQDPAGLPALRRAIAEMLGATRAMSCEPGQILVTGGSQQALDIACRLLVDPGEKVMIEDPGFRGTDAALGAAGAIALPQPVDGEGLQVPNGLGGIKAVVVTPSRNFPLGSILSLPRRLALLRAAAASGSWIVEDDFDAEFRFSGRPLASLFGLDRQGQVLYAGTFSRTMFPALRLGYLVVPPPLVDAARAVRQASDGGEATPLQAALAGFIEEGHYAAQMRRRRRQLAAARAALSGAVEDRLGGRFEIMPADGGLSLTLRFREPADDKAIADILAAGGIAVRPLSPFYRSQPARQGLVLNYAGWEPEQLNKAVARMAAILMTSECGQDQSKE
jgi:GntR family transcriptional regulator/MocR family aminotransferase